MQLITIRINQEIEEGKINMDEFLIVSAKGLRDKYTNKKSQTIVFFLMSSPCLPGISYQWQ